MRTLALLPTLLLALSLPICAQTADPRSPNSKAPLTADKPQAKMTTKPNAEWIERSALIIDSHADTPQRFVDEGFDLADPLGAGNMNFDSIHKGNLGAEFFSIWVEPKVYKGQYARRTLELIDSVKQQVARHPDQMVFASSVAGIEEAHRNHKFAALMGIEGGHSIEDSIPLLRQYYALGVRYMTLTWSNSNGWADSSGDVDDKTVTHTKEGLTEFGKDVVYEMNRLGMMVDISHVSDKTFYRTLVISRAPVIASHSGARALCSAPRNMTDEMILAVARSGGPESKGGVVQVNFFSGFVSQAYWDTMKAQSAEATKAVEEAKAKAKTEGREFTYADEDKIQRSFMDKIPRPPLSMLIDHIDHIAKVAGVDHVGLGSDFDGVSGQLPEGLDSAADLPKIAAALVERGYSAEDIRKILGGNLLRVFKEVEQVSKQLQAEARPRLVEKQPFEKAVK
jgi:membrane dipeptidase